MKHRNWCFFTLFFSWGQLRLIDRQARWNCNFKLTLTLALIANQSLASHPFRYTVCAHKLLLLKAKDHCTGCKCKWVLHCSGTWAAEAHLYMRQVVLQRAATKIGPAWMKSIGSRSFGWIAKSIQAPVYCDRARDCCWHLLVQVIGHHPPPGHRSNLTRSSSCAYSVKHDDSWTPLVWWLSS